MRVLPDPNNRFSWKIIWISAAVAISLLLSFAGPISVPIGLACAYLITLYLKNKARGQADDADRLGISDFIPDSTLTLLSLDAPAEKPEDLSKKQGAA